jgi:hypothetical protein
MNSSKAVVSLQARIALTMGFLALLMLIIGALGLTGAYRANRANRDTYENKLTATTNLGNAEIYIARTRLVLDRVALHPDAPDAAAQVARASGFFNDSDDWWQKFVQQAHETNEADLIADATQHRQALRSAVVAFIEAVKASNREQVDKIAMTQLSAHPDSLIAVILNGSRLPSTAGAPSPLAMPPFAWRYDDEEVADLATFIRSSWGNHASHVTADQVKDVRAQLKY